MRMQGEKVEKCKARRVVGNEQVRVSGKSANEEGSGKRVWSGNHELARKM